MSLISPATSFAAFAVECSAESIPIEVRERAKLHLLDTLGCGLAAVGVEAAGEATTIAAAQGGQPEASIIGNPVLVPAALAALANGTRCHGLDFDDTHERGICHSSTVVAPAALALGEATRSTGEAILTAYLVGTEVALRIAVATADGLYARGFHPTPVCAVFGATAAACRLLGMAAGPATAALGIAGSFASGLFEYLSDGSATKPLHAGWASQAGIQAARLARAGATGPASVIEGRFGLVASHTDVNLSGDALTDGLGEAWEAANISIKPFPACHFLHSSVWAAAELAEEHGVATDDIAEIAVRIPSEGEPLVLQPLEAKLTPKTPYDAKFSLPFALAHRLVHGRLDLAAFSAASIGDPRVLALAARVRAEPLHESPSSRFAGGARLVTRDGTELDRFVPHPPGSPGNPLEDSWIVDKFTANAELSLEPAQAAELADVVRSFDDPLAPQQALTISRRGARRC